MLGQVPKEYGGSYTTGVANVIISLSKPMQNMGVNVKIFATNYNQLHNSVETSILGYDKHKLVELLFRELTGRPLALVRELVDYKKRFGSPAIKLLSYRLMLDHHILNYQPDIIHAHGVIFAPVVKHLRTKKKALFTFHGIFIDDDKAIKENLKKGTDLIKLSLNSAKLIKHVSYLTPAMSEIGNSKLEINANETIISNGVDCKKFYYSVEARKEIRHENGCNDYELIVISVGALTSRKNHKAFIKFIHHNNIKCKYWIVGKEGGELNALNHLIARLGLSESVKIFPYVDHANLYKYYSAADIYIHPSTSEGQALVVLEAMSSGLPVIVNEQIQETLGNISGFEQYIEAVNLDSHDYHLQREFYLIDRINLSQKCSKYFTWEAMAREYLKFYSSIIENPTS